jgi:hypothetical protein
MVEVPASAPRSSAERSRLEARTRPLAWGGNVWHLVEFALALGAGIAAGSVALFGFGADRATVAEAEQNQICAYLAPRC